ncbi:MAG TPA: methyltransferase domain-containing protein [Nonomuraea sp.]|nr:methyltransferase domain-containing protein [Nonomuraea sp.]
MPSVSKRLLALLGDVAAVQPTVLEFGSGSGALAVSLAASGATSVDGIDLSPASVEVARRRAEEAGVSDRVSFKVGDGSQATVAAHDWVVLDRVMCCFPHFDALLHVALPAARSRLAFAVPNSRGWRGHLLRALVWVGNLYERVTKGCPGYVHSLDRIEGRIAEAGFRLKERGTGLWYVAVWERAEPAV